MPPWGRRGGGVGPGAVGLHVMALPGNRPGPRQTCMRTLIATAAGLAGFALYVMAAVTLADFLPAFWPVQAAYFVAAGTLWVIPARWLMLWAAGMTGKRRTAA